MKGRVKDLCLNGGRTLPFVGLVPFVYRGCNIIHLSTTWSQQDHRMFLQEQMRPGYTFV